MRAEESVFIAAAKKEKEKHGRSGMIAVFDVCDRKTRKDDEEHRNEKTMMVEPTDSYVVFEDSDSEVEGLTIDSGDCVHYTINIPCSCPTPPPCQ